MKKTLNLILVGSILAAAGTATAQLTTQQQGQGNRPAQPQQREARPALPQQTPEEQRAPERDPAEMQAKLEALHAELEEISVQLNEIHQEALLQEDVREYLVEYEGPLLEKMRDSAPGLEDQVEELAAVIEEIGNVEGDAGDLSSGDRQELEQRLEQQARLKQQLAPIEGQFMNDPEMQQARVEYQQNLIAAMNEIDSDVEEIIQERMELAQNFMTLQQEFLQSQQPAQGQPQGGQGQPQPR